MPFVLEAQLTHSTIVLYVAEKDVGAIRPIWDSALPWDICKPPGRPISALTSFQDVLRFFGGEQDVFRRYLPIVNENVS